jgi:hypothetical protein
MKIFSIFIGLLLLFILIPPENKINPNCYIITNSYQEKVIFIFDDIKCVWKNLELNLITRINNFYSQSTQILEISKEAKNVLKTTNNNNIPIKFEWQEILYEWNN